jgi:DnaJ-domain-containing protein 1
MTLDHGSGSVEGRVLSGAFKGRNLIDLDEIQTRRLLDEVTADPDSLALLETWLDKNRPGWREYFAAEGAAAAAGASNDNAPVDLDAEAYEVLGLRPGATEDEIRAAHRKLMMGVHPDQGGSNYLASKINAAKDRLLKKLKS